MFVFHVFACSVTAAAMAMTRSDGVWSFNLFWLIMNAGFALRELVKETRNV
jgi:hypothetical protein